MFWRALTRRPDVVFVVAPSLVSAVAGWVSARLSGAKLWVHVQDFEVEAGFATGAFSPDSRIGRAARAFEGWMLRRCDRVSSISASMVRKLVAKGVDPARTFELRNWANLDHVDVVTGANPARDRLGITTRYVALYSGNVAAKQGIEIIPQAARLLRDRDDLTFLICGQGPLLDTLKAQAADLPNVRFAPLQPIEHFSQTLGLAEVEGAGVITPPGDAPALAAALTELLQDPERHARLSRQARSRALDRWNKPAILDRFLAAADDAATGQTGRFCDRHRRAAFGAPVYHLDGAGNGR